ncbi:hypothetical protein APS_0876 [Acetobacter pasteurianus subsp. pasteurianus LMG 1262 = NBRC 106471]|nr:hypothetical protein APS_0876 [Acetobacter pasteurianus subsp. pasteurianus LMG 1262 = NBRC 106471]
MTSGPTEHQGPITTPCPSRAPGATRAVGWTTVDLASSAACTNSVPYFRSPLAGQICPNLTLLQKIWAV